MALDANQIAYRDKHIEELREYWVRVSESEGFDIEGIPPVANGMARRVCRSDPIEYPYMAMVNSYARMGLHRYNFSHGTHFKFMSVKKFNYTDGCLQSYFITLNARDPVTKSQTTFQVGVSEERFAKLHLKCFIARPKGTLKTLKRHRQPHDIPPKYELPHWPSDLNDTTRFYEVKESELKSNDWIHLYLELAIVRNDPLIPAEVLSGLKIVKVSIKTSEDVEPNERLQAKSATFYITFKNLANARVGELGEDVERKVIVRRVVDELTGDFTLFGGFGFYIGEVAEERPMSSTSVERPTKRRRRPPLDWSVLRNQCTFEYEKKHNLPYPK
ncbi:hypothetical protein V5N11_032160 [Cardamine amara subsp. amara]|uniref:Uncharacterized protein n=1 Tax=Cardamine amara subsp. amara TaxID=228776 RepID=A0ABD0Z8G3_CARAN